MYSLFVCVLLLLVNVYHVVSMPQGIAGAAGGPGMSSGFGMDDFGAGPYGPGYGLNRGYGPGFGGGPGFGIGAGYGMGMGAGF